MKKTFKILTAAALMLVITAGGVSMALAGGFRHGNMCANTQAFCEICEVGMVNNRHRQVQENCLRLDGENPNCRGISGEICPGNEQRRGNCRRSQGEAI